ncbi:hypothetical protein H1164_03800 [Thermoactinomyces daqus]|uniref:Ead/Ea22-like family protein n=1 Tax=Thermoactinomyces daqus TaxID=1329516 RepID=A0A7W2AHC3_9BACL|nr:hypothetical protein [Thermoactinomyces daqus]MBA4542025.1 hypothetical protein [Thermoactinomyces daqus]
MMTKRDLLRDLEIAKNATPGPWFAYHRGGVGGFDYEVTLPDDTFYVIAAELSEHNAKFIAEAREGWPEAIRRAIEAENELAQLRAEIQHHIDLMMSAAELMSDDVDPEQRGKADAYLTVVKALREILDCKTE